MRYRKKKHTEKVVEVEEKYGEEPENPHEKTKEVRKKLKESKKFSFSRNQIAYVLKFFSLLNFVYWLIVFHISCC
jgi:hypothetical protein